MATYFDCPGSLRLLSNMLNERDRCIYLNPSLIMVRLNRWPDCVGPGKNVHSRRSPDRRTITSVNIRQSNYTDSFRNIANMIESVQRHGML